MKQYRIPKPLSLPDVRLLLSAAEREHGQPFADALQVMATTGIRVAEIGKLRVADVIFERRLFRIPAGKWTPTRHIPFGPSVLMRLRSRQASVDTSEYLFGTSPDRLRAYLTWRFRKLANTCLPGRTVSLHQLRRTFAEAWLSTGGGIPALAYVMGYNLDSPIFRR